MRNYKELMDRLLTLPTCALVTTGRTGTDLLQSLLDEHPEVLLFNGSLRYHAYWNSSICVSSGTFAISDYVDEFIGKYLERFKSRYDLLEGKDRLGNNFDQSLDIDLVQYKREVLCLLEGRNVTPKNSLVAIYAAYALCLGQDIDSKALLFHHPHHFDELDAFLADFPDSKVIVMTRDPRANFVSGIDHWRKYWSGVDDGRHLYKYIARILADATVLQDRAIDYMVVRIERLGSRRVIQCLCDWLNIAYNECLTRSTWGGLTWHGDRVSEKTNVQTGWSSDMLENKWETNLSVKDKYVLGFVMSNRLRHYGYPYKNINVVDAIIMPFLIMLPLRYETRFFTLSYLRKHKPRGSITLTLRNIVFYLRRVHLFMKYYARIIRNDEFSCRFV